VQKLFRFTDSVVFSFDGDAAGQRAARKALDAALPFATDVRSVKFLFLPPEHDPDSFIREFGKDAFARYVSEAVPLSRFLIDAAREGCDLNTAEGRAHMASNAKPLWMQLPDGALKRQLLTEIADQVQLASRELTDLWTPKPVGKRSEKSNHYQNSSGSRNESASYSANSREKSTNRPRLSGRALPASRADHATRILLGHMAALDVLSAEDHAMLCELPAPHGPLFVWLESQLHEHGPQPWVALREGLRGHESEELAVRLMTGFELGAADETGESASELRNLLNRMLVERLKVQETEAIHAAKADPTALHRYRELQARRRQLESAPSEPD
jgi:DNA primase